MIDTHLILGEFNINTMVDNDLVELYLDMFTIKGFNLNIKTVTRQGKNGGSWIDYMFYISNTIVTNILCWSLKHKITDHFPKILAIKSTK